MNALSMCLHSHVNTFALRKCKFIDMKSLAERTLLARERVSLSQEAAAEAIGCSRGAIAMWESYGAKTISGKYLLDAARVYKVRPEWLSDGRGDDGYPWVYATVVQESPMAERSLLVAGSDVAYNTTTKPQVRPGPDADLIAFPVAPSHRGPDNAPTILLPRHLFASTPGLCEPHVQVAIAATDAMRGEIDPGAIVFIDTRVNTFKNTGIYAYLFVREPEIKRIQRIGPDHLRLLGTASWDITEPSGKGLNALKIIGQVVGVLPPAPPQPPIKLLG